MRRVAKRTMTGDARVRLEERRVAGGARPLVGHGAQHAGALLAAGTDVADDDVPLALIAFLQDVIGFRHERIPRVHGTGVGLNVALLE